MSNKIDLDLIKKYVNISEEELMERLVKDAVGLQKEAEENEHKEIVAARLADETYCKYVRMFWHEYDYLCQYFPEDEVLQAAAEFMASYCLVTELTIPGHIPADKPLPYPAIFKRYGYADFQESKNGWMREVRKPATFYIVADNYQLHTSEAMKWLLERHFPYLKDWQVSVYDLSNQDDWIYVSIPSEQDKPLYVPVSALVSKDADAIVQTHLNYWHTFSGGYADAREMAFVESEGVKAFLDRVREGK